MRFLLFIFDAAILVAIALVIYAAYLAGKDSKSKKEGK